MAWIRIDDHFDEHPKLAAVGPIGWGVWLAGLAYCNRNLTDGFIPYHVADRIAGSWRVRVPTPDGRVQVWKISRSSGMVGEDLDAEWVIGLLVQAGLWEEVEGGYRVHDYLDYQPSREEVEAERAIARRRAAMNANPELRRIVRERDGDNCRYCGITVNWRDRKGPDGGTYDHVIPIDQGGDESPDNIVVCCRRCNLKKGARTPEEAGMRLLPPGTKTLSSRNQDGIKTESDTESRHPKPKPNPKPNLDPTDRQTPPNPPWPGGESSVGRSSDDELSAELAAVARHYADRIGILSPWLFEQLRWWLVEQGMEAAVIMAAIDKTADAKAAGQVRTNADKFLMGVLRNSWNDGIRTAADLQARARADPEPMDPVAAILADVEAWEQRYRGGVSGDA